MWLCFGHDVNAVGAFNRERIKVDKSSDCFVCRRQYHGSARQGRVKYKSATIVFDNIRGVSDPAACGDGLECAQRIE